MLYQKFHMFFMVLNLGAQMTFFADIYIYINIAAIYVDECWIVVCVF